jgi:hypothetical protein
MYIYILYKCIYSYFEYERVEEYDDRIRKNYYCKKINNAKWF